MRIERAIASAVLVGLVACGSGCTTLHRVEPDPAGAVTASIEVGERIRVVETSGTSVDLEVTAVGADFIEGKNRKGAQVRVAVADIREVSERRVDFVKTSLLGAGVGYVVAAAVAAIALASIL